MSISNLILAISKENMAFQQKALHPNCTQTKGMVLSIAAKMFTIAGPIIIYCLAASMVYEVAY